MCRRRACTLSVTNMKFNSKWAWVLVVWRGGLILEVSFQSLTRNTSVPTLSSFPPFIAIVELLGSVLLFSLFSRSAPEDALFIYGTFQVLKRERAAVLMGDLLPWGQSLLGR